MRVNNLWIAFMAPFMFIGCGPLTAHSTIARAHIAIEAARGAEADKLAIFEYLSAKLYLRKAKQEEGLSSFQSAIDLAIKSRRFADEARGRALKVKHIIPMTPEEMKRARPVIRRRQKPMLDQRTPPPSVAPAPPKAPIKPAPILN